MSTHEFSGLEQREDHLGDHVVVAIEDFGDLIRHPLLDHRQVDLGHVNFLAELWWKRGITHRSRVCARLERCRHDRRDVVVVYEAKGRRCGRRESRGQTMPLPEQVKLATSRRCDGGSFIQHWSLGRGCGAAPQPVAGDCTFTYLHFHFYLSDCCWSPSSILGLTTAV